MTDTAISIQADGSTLRIADPVTGEQYAIHADQPVTPTPSNDDLAVPVSQTVRLEAEKLIIDASAWVRLRDEDGINIRTLRFNNTISREDGKWLLVLAGPVKSYAQVYGPFTVTTTPDNVTIEWEMSSEIVLGVRSYRRHPTETITTTCEPVDIATAISHLSAGLETLSSERSFQTLRNHPPDIEIGDELQIPDSVSRHDSLITLSLPFQYEYLYPAAPVAYYLNATLAEGDPAIHIDGYGTWDLPRGQFAERCAELLKQCVFLDCLTRSDGLYPTTLEAEAVLDERLGFDWTNLYDESLAERTAHYLDIEYATIADEVPEWPARGYVPPTADSTSILPHLIDQLIPVETCCPDPIQGADARDAALGQFVQTGNVLDRAAVGQSTFNQETPFTEIPDPPEQEALWTGDEIPFGANHLLETGIRRYHAADQPSESEISVTLVCNEGEMQNEIKRAEAIYGSREKLQLNVDVYQNLTTNQLAERLREPSDLFHFVGHASIEGLHCPDGIFSPRTLNSVRSRAFVLNACSSYVPGRDLVKRGAIGGVVTLSDVTEEAATQVGVMTANLLSIGFSLRNALLIARTRSVTGGQYMCVGMDSLWLTPNESSMNSSIRLNKKETGWRVEAETYPSLHFGVGSLITHNFTQDGTTSIVGKSITRDQVSDAVLRDYLTVESSPVWYDGEWTWGDELVERLWGTDDGE
ncbi:hypothetical protein [Halosegnis rubeus]|uniref:CHAT domain-containing protein n=1 Tax=Halosegnis rubeus TaxID=2212850 RepID=A0A5N5UJ04_9EURY|nr:hypothetical protein [Halosegnis rubeus]KAB7518739.1 hypothetical protein DP108_06110 [Halosegnis rubeus]